GYDGMAYDTPRNLSSALYSSIYTIIEGIDKKFAIQGKNTSSLNLNEIIPLGFETSINVATLYTLSIASLEGSFLTSNDIYIVDHLLNTTQSLKSSGYTFTSDTGEFNDRFEIVFTPNTLSNLDFNIDSSALSIIELNNGDVQFKLASHLEMETVEILDLLGRTIYVFNTSGNEQIFNMSQLSQSTYLAKVKLNNDYYIIKKAIKQK
ncbi:MAG: T9SS type A sorting domain-containing protein, partial [Flavobacteriaceae bacterium]|nr:T9SS type A sorting domain-containing protein [Flavobacteriaceae bacterium]